MSDIGDEAAATLSPRRFAFSGLPSGYYREATTVPSELVFTRSDCWVVRLFRQIPPEPRPFFCSRGLALPLCPGAVFAPATCTDLIRASTPLFRVPEGLDAHGTSRRAKGPRTKPGQDKVSRPISDQMCAVFELPAERVGLV